MLIGLVPHAVLLFVFSNYTIYECVYYNTSVRACERECRPEFDSTAGVTNMCAKNRHKILTRVPGGIVRWSRSTQLRRARMPHSKKFKSTSIHGAAAAASVHRYDINPEKTSALKGFFSFLSRTLHNVRV